MEVRAGREGGERDPIVRATSYSSSTVSLLLASSLAVAWSFSQPLSRVRVRVNLSSSLPGLRAEPPMGTVHTHTHGGANAPTANGQNKKKGLCHQGINYGASY